MKVIATTSTGYLVEATAREIAQISGNESLNVHPSSYYDKGCIPEGTKVNVHKMWEHVRTVVKHKAERKSIAEQLRAAATVVETTPDVVDIPEPKEKKQAEKGENCEDIKAQA